jgi:hypothetical protein
VLFGEFFTQLSVISAKNRQISVLKNYWKIFATGDISIFIGDTFFNNGSRCEEGSCQMCTWFNSGAGRDDAIIEDGSSSNLRASAYGCPASEYCSGINLGRD